MVDAGLVALCVERLGQEDSTPLKVVTTLVQVAIQLNLQ